MIYLYLVYEAGMLLIIVPFYFINGTPVIKLNSLFEMLIRSTHFIAMCIGFYLAGINGIVYGLIASTFVNIPFQYYMFHKKIITTLNGTQFLQVILPVVFMLGLVIFDNVIFQVSLLLAMIISCKLIYFDPAKQHTEQYSSIGSLLGRLENK